MPSGDIIPLKVLSRPHDTLDRPLHDLRISVMDRCNFRCPYCMPRETFHENYRFLKSSERLSFEEITRLTRLFVQLGVRKVRLTGGEPLLRPSVSDYRRADGSRWCARCRAHNQWRVARSACG